MKNVGAYGELCSAKIVTEIRSSISNAAEKPAQRAISLFLTIVYYIQDVPKIDPYQCIVIISITTRIALIAYAHENTTIFYQHVLACITGAKQHLTQNGHSWSSKVTCYGVSGKAIRD